MLRRATHVPRRGRASRGAHRRLDEALPGTRPHRRAVRSPGARPRPSRSRSSSRCCARWPRTSASAPSVSSVCPTASTSTGSWPPISRGRASTTTSAIFAVGWPSTPTCPCSRTTHRPPRRPRGLPRAPHRALPQGGRPGPRTGAARRRPSSSSARRSACWPRAWPTSPSRCGRRAARAGRGRAPASRSASRYDPEVVAAVPVAGESLDAVRGNVAWLLHERRRPGRRRGRLRRAVGSPAPGPGREGGGVPHRPDVAGLHLLLRRGPARCAGPTSGATRPASPRLLTEQLVPADLAAAAA